MGKSALHSPVGEGDCSSSGTSRGSLNCILLSDIDLGAERLLWFKTGIHVYDVVDLAEEYAVQAPPAGP